MTFIDDLKNFENLTVKIETQGGSLYTGLLKTVKDDYVVLAAEHSTIIPIDKITSITILKLR
jgi:small nuclear ribonucleoprotein (snRNP)-like protein